MARVAEKLNAAAAKRLIDSIDNVLFDCDGVLWHGMDTIPGGPETVDKLKQLGKRVFYVTNNSSRSREQNAEIVKSHGYLAVEDEIVCTAYVAAEYLHEQGFKGKVYVMGTSNLAAELEKFGIAHTGTEPDPPPECFKLKELMQTELDPEIKCVLVGFDINISYMKLIKASSYAKKKDCLFLATNDDPFLPLKGDIVIPGSGVMVNSVRMASKRDPLILGKPEKPIFEVLHKAHNVDAARTVIIGDVLETDIALGSNCGLKSVLVLSGAATLDDVHAYEKSNNPSDNKFVPDFYTDSIADLLPVLNDS
ncbi:hypothetical protein ScPMuIL_015927 [Solemya velum]